MLAAVVDVTFFEFRFSSIETAYLGFLYLLLNNFAVQFVMARSVLIFKDPVQIELITLVKFFINGVATPCMARPVMKGRLNVHKSTNFQPTVGFLHKKVIIILVIAHVAFEFTLFVLNVLTLNGDL